MLRSLGTVAIVFFCWLGQLQSQEPPAAATWPPVIARKLPPAGKPISEDDRSRLMNRMSELSSLRVEMHNRFSDRETLDSLVLIKAVMFALRNSEFFDPKKDVEKADAAFALAEKRLRALASSSGAESLQGVSIRGFRSQLDGEVQPYGLIVPPGLDTSKPVPLYVWLHGRGDTQCDLQFCYQFMGTKAPGPLQPADAVVLHPFGRYCNGWKSAGEIDVLEAIEDVKKRLKIDENRIVLAGFSMGGAGAWHMGAHYTDRWCAVHAGAGFVDVRRYQNVTPDKMPPWYEEKLWGLYDVPDYRRNLLNVPVIAYSGEDDKQKAAADIMEAELAAEGYKIPHFIGPKMGHKYHPEVLVDVQKKIADAVAKGRDEFPAKVSLQTKTLRYHRMHWVSILRLKKHWEDSRLDVERTDANVTVSTRNVVIFRLEIPRSAGERGVKFAAGTKLIVDGQGLIVPRDSTVLTVGLVDDGKWSLDFSSKSLEGLHKTPGLQGPIDDGFMSEFCYFIPKFGISDGPVDRWVEFERLHAVVRWEELMRGHVLYAAQREGADINAVLWGTPATNPEIAKILDRLPIKWTDKTVGMGDLEFDATKVVPVLIYPHPKNPNRYVVINSGLTFREAHDRTNSLQNPKLGDWAFIDITQPPTDEAPGKVLASGFFDENWQYVPQPK
jgi:predicted esterase